MEKIAPDRTITRLIGVDPVNKPGGGIFGDSPKSLSNVGQIIHVDATGSAGRIDDGNFIRGLGRGVGGGRPDIFKNENTIFIEAPYAHFNFNGLMNHTPIGGQSARDLLLGLPAPTPAPTK